MKENKLRTMIEQGMPIIGTRIHSTWPTVVEAVGSTSNFDYIEFLGEYAPYNLYDLENICRAAELNNMATIMKVDYQNRGYVAQKAIASGFQGILFTDHHTAKEVEETLKMIKPECPQYDGKMGYANRRWIGYRKQGPQLEFADMAARTVAAFMIEKKEALDNIDDICSVPGVDMVQFGAYDYSMSCGFNSKDYLEEVRAAERKMIEAAIRHHVRPRCEIDSAEQAKYYMDLGVKDFALGYEIRIKVNFWQDQGNALHELLKQK